MVPYCCLSSVYGKLFHDKRNDIYYNHIILVHSQHFSFLNHLSILITIEVAVEIIVRRNSYS